MNVVGKIRMIVAVLLILTGPGAMVANAQGLVGRYIVCQMTAGETLLYALDFGAAGVVSDVALIAASFEISSEDVDPDTAAQFVIGIPEGVITVVGADGSFAFTGLDLAGMVSRDGQFISFVRTTAGGISQLAFGIRTGAGLSDTTLTGNAFIHVLELDIVGTTAFDLVSASYVIDATFNGMGMMRGEIVAGTIVDAEPVVSADYRVEENGQLTIDFKGMDNSDIPETPDNGVISSDGAVFAAVDTTWGDGDIRILIGIRQTREDTLTAADFASDYYFTELAVNGPIVVARGQFIDTFGELSFDGFASYHLNPLFTTCQSPLKSSTDVITVYSDGLFQADSLLGTLQSDGELFVSSTISPDTSGLRVAFSQNILIVDPRRQLVVEPEDNDDFCFIGASGARH